MIHTAHLSPQLVIYQQAICDPLTNSLKLLSRTYGRNGSNSHYRGASYNTKTCLLLLGDVHQNVNYNLGAPPLSPDPIQEAKQPIVHLVRATAASTASIEHDLRLPEQRICTSLGRMYDS